MKKIIRLLSLIIVLVCAFTLAVGCNNKENEQQAAESKYSISTTSCTINRFDTYKLRITPQPAAAETVEWFSYNANVATVDGGVVTAVSVGSTTVEARVGGETLTCSVRIINNGTAPSIFLDSEEICLSKDGKFMVAPKIMYNGALYDNGTFTYEVLDETVCKIENGEITGLAYGETKLYVYGAWKSASELELVKVVDVKVKKDSNLLIEQSDVSVYTETISYKDESYSNATQLTAKLFAEGKEITGKQVEWKVSDESLITVSDNGLVTANEAGKTGTAYVWVEYSDEEIDVSSDKLEVKVDFPIIDKTDEIELVVDNSIGAVKVDAAEVFGKQGVITEVYDTKFAYKNLYQDEQILPNTKITGEREWVIKGERFGVKLSAVCATKVLRTSEDLHVFDEQGTNVIEGYYVLDGDIDASDYVPTTHAWSSTCDFGFGGTFDGRNYAIKNIKLTTGGLFGSLTSSGVVKNLAFVDVKIFGQVIAHTSMGKLQNVFIHIAEKYASPADDIYAVFSQPKGGSYDSVYVLVENSAEHLERKQYVYGVSSQGAWSNTFGINMVADSSTMDVPGITTYESHSSTNDYGIVPAGWITVSGIPCPASASAVVAAFANK